MVTDRTVLSAILGAIGELAYKLTKEHLVVPLKHEDGSTASAELYTFGAKWITPEYEKIIQQLEAESLFSDVQESSDKIVEQPTLQSATEKEQKQFEVQ